MAARGIVFLGFTMENVFLGSAKKPHRLSGDQATSQATSRTWHHSYSAASEDIQMQERGVMEACTKDLESFQKLGNLLVDWSPWDACAWSREGAYIALVTLRSWRCIHQG